MRPLRTQKRLRDYLLSVPALVALAVLAGFAGHRAWRSFGEYVRAADARERAAVALAEREREIAALELEAAETPDRAREREIRETLRFTRPGEEVILITNAEGVRGEAASVPSQPWWRRFLNWFIK